MLYQPIRNLSQVNDTVQQALSAADRLFEIFDVAPDVQDATDARPLPPLRGHVRFERVSFQYDTGEAVLRDVDLEALEAVMRDRGPPSSSPTGSPR
jgi:ABC-type multidrug transport system fused ATPase/permease subunit